MPHLFPGFSGVVTVVVIPTVIWATRYTLAGEGLVELAVAATASPSFRFAVGPQTQGKSPRNQSRSGATCFLREPTTL
jgi:hypothetical protein